MRPTAELRLPMVPVAVELATTDAAASSCELYVPDMPRVGRHALADDLASLLEAPPPFLPVRSGGGVVLVGKRAIRWVALAIADAEVVPADGVPAPITQPEPSEVLTLFDSKHDIEVSLDDGHTLFGAVLHSSPADRPRVIDHLNGPPRFLRLWTSRAHYLVNKRHIARVREVA